MSSKVGNRAARRRAASLGPKFQRMLAKATAATRLEGASSPKAAIMRVVRTVETTYGPESQWAKMTRAYARDAFAELAEREAAQVAFAKSWRGRWAAMVAWLTGVFASKPEASEAVLEAAPTRAPDATRPGMGGRGA